MKTFRQVVLLLYCASALCISLYVPWKVEIEGMRFPAGYAFLWNPASSSVGRIEPQVDIVRVVLAFVALTATAGLVLLLGELGKTVWPFLVLPRWLFNRAVLWVIAVSIVGGLSVWFVYARRQESQPSFSALFAPQLLEEEQPRRLPTVREWLLEGFNEEEQPAQSRASIDISPFLAPEALKKAIRPILELRTAPQASAKEEPKQGISPKKTVTVTEFLLGGKTIDELLSRPETEPQTPPR